VNALRSQLTERRYAVNTGFAICAVMIIPLLILAVIFAALKGKAAIILNGFNDFSKEERAKYDTARISKDYRNNFLIWAGVFAVGAVLSYFISGYFVILTVVVWLVLVLKDSSLDPEKAFAKYKIEAD
jgi:hypothetical protein